MKEQSMSLMRSKIFKFTFGVLALTGVILAAVLAFNVGVTLATHSSSHGLPCTQSGLNKQWDRCQGEGYFTNKDTYQRNIYDPTVADGYIIYAGNGMDNDYETVYNVNDFVSRIRTNVNKSFSGCTNEERVAAGGGSDYRAPNGQHPPYYSGYQTWPSCFQRKKDAVQAAFFIATQLGVDGDLWLGDYNVPYNDDASNWNNDVDGVNWAKSHLDEWEYIVRAFDARGWVNWDRNVNYSCSLGDKHSWNTRMYGGDQAWIANCIPSGDTTRRTIWFEKPGSGRSWGLVKNCSNLKGDVDSLTGSLNYDNAAGIWPNVTAAPGDTVTMYSYIANYGELTSMPGTTLLAQYSYDSTGGIQNLDHNYPTYAVTTVPSTTVTQITPAAKSFSGSASECRYQLPAVNGANFPPSRNACFYWRFNNVNPNSPSGYYIYTQFSFKIPDTAPDFSQACFTAYAQPKTPELNEASGGQACALVRVPNEPYVTTQRGSVQAGADWGDSPCLTFSNPSGNIKGTVRGGTGSKGDYIVSAGGNISNFGSAGSPSSNSLKFGQAPGSEGLYGRVCRPDVARDVLTDHSLDGKTVSSFAPSSFAANAIPNGISYHDGDVTISGGTLPNGYRGTLVVNGTVNITGNICATGVVSAPGCNTGGQYSSLNDIPTLGIIASGDINIAPNVTNIYGIYYAGTDNSAWSPLGTGTGLINTCQNPGAYPNPAIASNPAACGSALNVQGALVANNIYFRRTFGNANAGTGAAETISYIPQLLLRPPEGLGGISQQLRSDGERPPVF